jgi:Secretion system C-terminal sorting domain
MRFLSVLSFLLFVQIASAQSRFYKLYSGTGFDKGEDVLALPDSSYLIAGSSGSFEQNAQGFLMKIDSLGAYVWSQAYGAQETEEVKRVFYRPGMGYYLAGMSNSWSGGNYDPMLIFTDLSGNQQWIKTYQNPTWDRIHDGVQTKDTGFVLVGERQATLGAEADVFLMRLDKNGDTLWTKTLGTAGADRANSVIRVSDSLYVVGGEWFVADSSATKGFVMQINDQGVVQWFDTLGHLSGDFVVSDLTQTPFGIQFAGNHAFTPENHNVFSGSISINGQVINQNAPQDGTFISDDKCQQMAYLAPQDRSIYGIQVQNHSTFPEYFDLNFGYVDALFGYWLGLPNTMIINQGYDNIGNIRPTLDGGFIATGYNSVIVDGQNQLNGGSNVFVLKVNGDGSAYVQTDTVFATQQLVGLSPLFAGSEVLMFPNPVAAVLHFGWSGSVPKLIEIQDAMGNLLQRETMTPAQTIDLSNWPQGIYLVRIDGKTYPVVKN